MTITLKMLQPYLALSSQRILREILTDLGLTNLGAHVMATINHPNSAKLLCICMIIQIRCLTSHSWSYLLQYVYNSRYNIIMEMHLLMGCGLIDKSDSRQTSTSIVYHIHVLIIYLLVSLLNFIHCITTGGLQSLHFIHNYNFPRKPELEIIQSDE